jgi:hypothetical protein
VTTRPDGRVARSTRRCASHRRRRPTISHGIVQPTGVGGRGGDSAPDNHAAACPDGRVAAASTGGVRRRCRGPTVRVRIILAARVEVEGRRGAESSPDHHAVACPDRRVVTSSAGGAGGRRRRPCIREGIVPTTRGEESAGSSPTPYDHTVTSPNRRMEIPSARRIDRRRLCPRVQRGIVSATGVGDRRSGPYGSTPYDHEAPSPYRRVIATAARCARHRRRCPGIHHGIVAAARVWRAPRKLVHLRPDEVA